MGRATFKNLLILILILLVNHAFSQDGLGTISFKPEGMEVSQPYFKEGLAYLHSFEYKEAIDQFQMAQMLDPNFVLAYWGEALCYYYPLWNSQQYEMGKGTLLKLGIFEDDRLAIAKNELERGFLTTVEALFKDSEDQETRVNNYYTLLEALHQKYPDNEELGAFFALALIGKAKTSGMDSLNDRASRICQNILHRYPNHPGALNYLIYGNQTPEKAQTIITPASRYAKVASSSVHALHAGSHIYNALGMWDKSVMANKKAWDEAEKHVVENRLSLEDRNYHALWWLQYGYLQQGKYKMAEEMVQDMYLDARMSDSKLTRYHLINMKVAYLANTENWESRVDETEVPTRELNIKTKLADLFVKGLKAYHTNDVNRLHWISGQITDMLSLERNKRYGSAKEIYKTCGSDLLNPVSTPEDINAGEVVELQLLSMVALKENKVEKAKELLRQACEKEKSLPFIPGPPAIIKPSYELFGEVLLSLGEPKEAIKMLDLCLSVYPNRSITLKTKYRALKNSGNTTEAAKIKAILMSNWKNADNDVVSGL